ncbi:MAG: IS1182 family transposase [Candidatus Hodarchaeales archaeon]|jgi:transposase
MAYYKDYKNQDWILPPRIENIIPEDHICFLVDDIIGQMDFSVIDEKYQGPGHPAYPPKIMVKLLIMGTIDGLRSSRKIGDCVRENVIYIFLAGKLTPNFRTISDFRMNNPKLIEYSFREVVRFALRMKMVKLGHISIDGTKIKANASKNKTLKKDELSYLEKLIRKEIREGIIEDEIEDELHGKDNDGHELPEHIKSKGGFRKAIRELIEKDKIISSNKKQMMNIIEDYITGEKIKKKMILNKIENAQKETNRADPKKINLTDPESRLMLNKKHFVEQSYNTQITVDSENGIIIGNDVVQNETDQKELIPQIETSENTIGFKLPEGTEVSADNGYYNGTNIKYLDKRKFDGYIPDQNITSIIKGKKIVDKPFGKSSFEYDHKNDCYICPNGEKLPFEYDYFDKFKGKDMRIYQGANCTECALNKQCVKSKYGVKVIKGDEFEKERRDMVKKLKSEEGKRKYNLRIMTAEYPFGNIKQNMGLREFLTRGINKVKTEFNLACIAHNLRRIQNILVNKNMKIQKIPMG